MPRKLIVGVPEYFEYAMKPQNFEDFCDRYERAEHSKGPLGLWCIKTVDKFTGEVLVEQWRKNVLLDTGGTAYLARTFGSAVPTTMFGQFAITTNCGSTTLTTALTNGQTAVTSLAVAALPAAIAANTGGVATTAIVGYGTGTTQTVTLSGAASSGATSISTNSYTSNAAYAIGTAVVPQPAVGENPSSLGGTISYSGAQTNITYTPSGSGAGNRSMVMSYTFSTTGTPAATAGVYTECWIINTAASTAVSATGQCAVHVTFMGMAVNSSSNGSDFAAFKY